MKKINLIILFLLCTTVSKVIAQQSMFIAQYSVGFPVGDLNKFISKTSWRGATLEYKSMVDDGIGVGVQTGWNAWYEAKDYSTYTIDQQSLSGKQWRYCSTVPVLATLDYYLKPGERVNPFAGLGIGTMFSRTNLDVGIWTKEINTWQFAFQPEVGVVVQTSPGTGLIISAKYYSALKNKELDSNLGYFALNVGFEWGQ